MTTTLTHDQASDQVVWELPAASVLRQVLLDSPFGACLAGRAVVDLLERAGLLADAEFVEAALVVETDDEGVPVWADLDLYAVAVCSRGEHSQVQLPETVQRLLAVVVLVCDLDAELDQLPVDARDVALDALRAVAGPARAGAR